MIPHPKVVITLLLAIGLFTWAGPTRAAGATGAARSGGGLTAGSGGKMVVSLTVEPDGTVSSVILVEDSLRSAAVSDCVTAQMRGWKFPAIETGTVTFKTPFVFTPPD